ncbi:MAG: hypothetical protein M3512_02910 [Bacteroidota bacterium]|nr:hypothetical protein [Bacteroidota bacterium]
MGALKDDLPRLIDASKDEKLLMDIFMILSGHDDYKEGDLWNGLTEEQKIEVLDSEKEIGKTTSWISHEELKKKNKKWLS